MEFINNLLNKSEYFFNTSREDTNNQQTIYDIKTLN